MKNKINFLMLLSLVGFNNLIGMFIKQFLPNYSEGLSLIFFGILSFIFGNKIHDKIYYKEDKKWNKKLDWIN